MATWRIDLAYDGSPFRGWARQPGQPTVQGAVEEALAILFGEPIALTVAGRTDAGVHARGQVASFDAPEPGGPHSAHRLVRGLNALTPTEVAVLSCRPAPDRFDARRDAISRAYTYRVEAGSVRSPFEVSRSWWWPYGVDPGALDECAALLTGLHDFTAFTPARTEHVRFERLVLAAAWSVQDPAAPGMSPVYCFEIEADAFMRNMVRILVGTMVEVASGKGTSKGFAGLLRGSPRSAAGRTAPAHGLYLERVRYRHPGAGNVD